MNEMVIKNYKEWEKATAQEKNEYIFSELKEALKNNDAKQLNDALSLAVWKTILEGIEDAEKR